MKKIILVSNSEDVDFSLVAELLSKSEAIIVQFNLCAHFKEISKLKTEKHYFFNVPDFGAPFGFDKNCRPIHDYGSGNLMFSARWPDDNHYLRRITENYGGTVIDREEAGLGDFDTANYGFSPSIGYQAAMHYSLTGAEVCLVGFDGNYPTGGHLGHSFYLEQLFMKSRDNITFYPSGNVAESHDGFASVFGEEYDLSMKPPAIILNVAKALFKEGRKEHALRFVEAVAVRFPNAARPAFDMFVMASNNSDPGGGIFDERIIRQFQKDRQGLMPIETSHTYGDDDFGYSKSSRPKRVLLVNETSKLPPISWHIGCHIVCDQIYKMLAIQGIECVGWINDAAGLSKILEIDPELSFDGIVVNAEGTFHDNAQRSTNLLLMLDHLKREYGKKVFFINGVWQNNNSMMNNILYSFDYISFRDSASVRQVDRKSDIKVVPDMTWNVEPIKRIDRPKPLMITDSVIREDAISLLMHSAETESDFFVMANYNKYVLRTLKASRMLPRIVRSANDFGEYETCITGRFHGACLALQAGAQVFFVPSNTHKTEAMFDDIGLDHRRFLWNPDGRDREAYSESDHVKIREYKESAVSSISVMFEDISRIL